MTVTVWAMFQFAAENVRLDAETVPSAVLVLATAMFTSAVGSLAKTTSKFAVPPASVVTRPVVGATLMPAASSSVLPTAMSPASTLL